MENIRNYSELNEEEQKELFNQYQKRARRKLNVSLFIYSLVVIVTIIVLLITYDNFISGYVVNDMISDYVKNYIIAGIVLVVIFYIIVLIINIVKRRGLKKVYTMGFQKYLYKKNIMLDSNNNQNNKSI